MQTQAQKFDGFVIDDQRFASESDANAYAESKGYTVLEWFPEDGAMVCDYEIIGDE